MAANAKPNGDYSNNHKKRIKAFCEKHGFNYDFYREIMKINNRKVVDQDSYQKALAADLRYMEEDVFEKIARDNKFTKVLVA